MDCVSCDICVHHIGLFLFFSCGIPQLQSGRSLSCDHGLDYASKFMNNSNIAEQLGESRQDGTGMLSCFLGRGGGCNGVTGRATAK